MTREERILQKAEELLRQEQLDFRYIKEACYNEAQRWLNLYNALNKPEYEVLNDITTDDGIYCKDRELYNAYRNAARQYDFIGGEYPDVFMLVDGKLENAIKELGNFFNKYPCE